MDFPGIASSKTTIFTSFQSMSRPDEPDRVAKKNAKTPYRDDHNQDRKDKSEYILPGLFSLYDADQAEDQKYDPGQKRHENKCT